MLASDVMSRAVITVPVGTGLAEAIRLMLEKRISGLPVVDAEGRLAGILTEGDLLRRSELGTQPKHAPWVQFLRGPGPQASDYVRAHARRVDEIMTSDVVTAEEDQPLTDVVAMMARRRIKRVPIVRDGHLVGLVSRADLLRVIGDVIAAEAGSGGPVTDAECERKILAALGAQGWVPHAGIRVRVKDGVATLEGIIYDERERQALRVAAENVAGVKEVRDELVWVEPVTGMVIDAGAV